MAVLTRKRRRYLVAVLYGFAVVELVIGLVGYTLHTGTEELVTSLLGAVGIALGATSILLSKGPDPRTTEELVSLLGEADRQEIEAWAARGERIRAIRRLRALTGLGLADTTRIYDSLGSQR